MFTSIAEAALSVVWAWAKRLCRPPFFLQADSMTTSSKAEDAQAPAEGKPSHYMPEQHHTTCMRDRVGQQAWHHCIASQGEKTLALQCQHVPLMRQLQHCSHKGQMHVQMDTGNPDAAYVRQVTPATHQDSFVTALQICRYGIWVC